MPPTSTQAARPPPIARRIGRTGRAGAKGESLTLITEADSEHAHTLVGILEVRLAAGALARGWGLHAAQVGLSYDAPAAHDVLTSQHCVLLAGGLGVCWPASRKQPLGSVGPGQSQRRIWACLAWTCS